VGGTPTRRQAGELDISKSFPDGSIQVDSQAGEGFLGSGWHRRLWTLQRWWVHNVSAVCHHLGFPSDPPKLPCVDGKQKLERVWEAGSVESVVGGVASGCPVNMEWGVGRGAGGGDKDDTEGALYQLSNSALALGSSAQCPLL
jgi:hypothetical protein